MTPIILRNFCFALFISHSVLKTKKPSKNWIEIDESIASCVRLVYGFSYRMTWAHKMIYLKIPFKWVFPSEPELSRTFSKNSWKQENSDCEHDTLVTLVMQTLTQWLVTSRPMASWSHVSSLMITPGQYVGVGTLSRLRWILERCR